MASERVVLGLASNQTQAEAIIHELNANGFANDHLSVLYPKAHVTSDVAMEAHSKAPEGALAGVGAGGVLGGTLGLIVGLGALAIPGIGPILAVGPLVAFLTGAAAGASVGGVAGGLIGFGIPEIEAKRYEIEIQSGNILIAVHAENHDERVRATQVFEHHGAANRVTPLPPQPQPVIEMARDTEPSTGPQPEPVTTSEATRGLPWKGATTAGQRFTLRLPNASSR